MTRLLPLLLTVSLLGEGIVQAIPNSFLIIDGQVIIGPIIPATPRFNANLTREFLDPALWEDTDLPGPWVEEPALESTSVQRMSANPVLFGAVPTTVRSYRESGRLSSIAITYLDAGPYFGYRGQGGNSDHAEEPLEDRRLRFKQHYRKLAGSLRTALAEGCGPGTRTIVGRSDLLRETVTDYRWEQFGLRLALRHEHSITLHLLPASHLSTSLLSPPLRELSPAQRSDQLRERALHRDHGEMLLDGIPMFPQGNTPLCGIHSLAMAGHYLGLRVPLTSLSAAAGFQPTGTARGANVLGVYRAVAEEVGMSLKTSSRFDPRRVTQALEEGLPVIVWRRVSLEREKALFSLADRRRQNPAFQLPSPTKADRASWPDRTKKSIPSHASLITGMDPGRHEVIFTEPWGEHARNRRMRIEEMEATTYAAFYFRW